MGNRLKRRAAGFSLLEMTVALGLGTIVLAAAVQMYTQSVSATWTVSQRAELQQDFRAASNILTRDLSLAGAGLGQGAEIQLPTSSTYPVYGCDQTSTCYITGGSVQYPKQGTTPYLYGLVTGYDLGPTLSTSVGATDIITVVYTDSTFYLNCYGAAIASATSVTFTLPTTENSNCTAPNTTTNPYPGSVQNVNDAAVGLTAGDLILFSFSGTQVVAEVTGATVTGTNGSGQTTYTVPFAASDPLKMNQGTTVTASLAKQSTGSALSGYGVRLLVITYYIDNTTTPPRLMRQVSGHSPIPIVEGAAYMKFSYDLYNSSTNSAAVSCVNPGAGSDVCTSGSSSGLLPNQITKVNVLNMAMMSTLKGSLFGLASGYQTIDLSTSVCPRNLTYVNNFNN
jgi:type II secretory pathway pseudopilin PulG